MTLAMLLAMILAMLLPMPAAVLLAYSLHMASSMTRGSRHGQKHGKTHGKVLLQRVDKALVRGHVARAPFRRPGGAQLSASTLERIAGVEACPT